MKCFGTSQTMNGIWAGVRGMEILIRNRAYADNLVTKARTTRLPEQRQAAHMAQTLQQKS